MLTGPTPPQARGKIQLLGALTAAVWLGGHEHPDRFGGPATDPSPHVVRPAVVAPVVRTRPAPAGPTRPLGVRHAARSFAHAVRISIRHRVSRGGLGRRRR